MTAEAAIRELFAESIRVKQVFLTEQATALAAAAGLLTRTLAAGGKLLLFGNGGSAADAQHIAAEFVGRFQRERRALPALALTTDTSALTAIGNDYGYEEVFARQLAALARPDDTALAFSTSGRSPNVLRAVAACHGLGVHTIGLSGGDGGELKRSVEVSLCVSASRLSARIQETHILIGHVLCDLVDRQLAGELG